MPELFQFGDFTLDSSGKKSHLNLDCQAFSPNEWHMLARIALPLLPPYHRVIGVHHGGLAWAWVLEHYIQPDSKLTLYVDDVWTTGYMMLGQQTNDMYREKTTFNWHGLVLFARGPVPENVTALFTLHKDLQ